MPGNKNVLRVPLINRDKVLMLPLLIKLGLIKNSVQALEPLPQISSVELCESKRMFVHIIGQQIRKVSEDIHFQDLIILKMHG